MSPNSKKEIINNFWILLRQKNPVIFNGFAVLENGLTVKIVNKNHRKRKECRQTNKKTQSYCVDISVILGFFLNNKLRCRGQCFFSHLEKNNVLAQNIFPLFLFFSERFRAHDKYITLKYYAPKIIA